MKTFIITVDTEGDNLWSYEKDKDKEITTENALFLPRFQELCNEYGFKPVWLTNYEMVMSDEFVSYMKDLISQDLCEIGIHIHAWNNPPLYHLDRKYPGNDYLIEYPDDIMRKKFKETYNRLKQKFGINVKSHRSGRWAMNDKYFELLEDFGVICDCSFTPTVSWDSAPGATIPSGSDYRSVPPNAHWVGKVLEVPMTIRNYNHFFSSGSLRHRIKTLVKGGRLWLRPALCSLNEMKKLVLDVSNEDDTDYLEFMIHSSELMPGGSPYFSTASQIEKLYEEMDDLFRYVKSLGYAGETLEAYTNRHSKS